GGRVAAFVLGFSRAGCDDAVRQCLRDGVRLTSPEERRHIRAVAEAKVGSLNDEDLRVLGYGEWLSGLEAGLAAHHAGLVPPFKEAVEACFTPALVHRPRPDQAPHLLDRSFARCRADADVVRLEAQLERTDQLLAAARARATCERGDVEEYRELDRHARGAARAGIRTSWSKDQVHQALERLKPGDVLSLPGAVAGGRLA